MQVNELIRTNPELQEKSISLDKPISLEYKFTPNEKVYEPNRNEKCPCGSGLKYKKCCMAISREIIDKMINY